MLTQTELNKAIQKITKRLDEVNQLYINKIATQILKIGKLNPSSINRVVIMQEMGHDVQEITHSLQLATNLNIKDIYQIYNATLNSVYTDNRFKLFLVSKPLTVEAKARVSRIAQLVAVQTQKTMTNISNTTAVQKGYKDAIDKAITAVTTGLGDYQSAMRETVKDLGYNGMQVYYASGYHRRLDTAVRQNIIDGVNQINQNASIAMGEELEMDAIELSAHLRSAPDHEPVQGRVFMKAEFEKMQNGEDFTDIDGNRYPGFRRPIGEWNCMHIAMGFSTKYSVRRYTDKQLKEWANANHSGCTIDNKHYTTYQAAQRMRRIETQVRGLKDEANAARASGDEELRKMCQYAINRRTKEYYATAKIAGINPDGQRLTVNGFKAVKV